MSLGPLELPVVDISSFLDAHSRNEDSLSPGACASLDSLRAACESHGMFYIGLNPIDDAHVRSALAAARSLFDLPSAVKRAAVPESPNAAAARGYLGRGAESGGAALEHKEAFSYAAEVPSGATLSSLQAPNVWPRGADAAKCELQRFRAYLARVAGAVSRMMGAALRDADIPAMAAGGERESLTRVFHYFAMAAADVTRGWVGSSAHTDWGMFTVIAQERAADAHAALEVRADGAWQRVRARGGALVCNCGDFLQLRTGGRWRSPRHRVVLSPRDRVSFVYFQYPAYDTPMPPVGARSAAEARGGGLSLLSDQRGDGGEWCAAGRCFGDVIAEKWVQVTRGARGDAG